LALFASFQFRAFSAEPIQWQIRGATDLVEILSRPIFAVHTKMPECAASFFAVSGLRGHTNFHLRQKTVCLGRRIVMSSCWFNHKINLTGFTIAFIERAAEILAGKIDGGGEHV
jgi:hypothetical protein